jgi:hypothetical protein
MKYALATALILFSTIGFSKELQNPSVGIDQKVLGGDILLVKMKQFVVISGQESLELVAELGPEKKKDFTHDIVMAKPSEQLTSLYNPDHKKKTVQLILNRYADALAKIERKAEAN